MGKVIDARERLLRKKAIKSYSYDEYRKMYEEINKIKKEYNIYQDALGRWAQR